MVSPVKTKEQDSRERGRFPQVIRRPGLSLLDSSHRYWVLSVMTANYSPTTRFT